jgi:1-acyl-sn-glycerol-3-phosphate acyltransferase
VFRLMPGWRMTIEGRENLEALQGRSVVITSNHQSNADVPVAFFLPLSFRWLAKESLFRIPIMGQAMRMAGYVPIVRGDKNSHGKAFEESRKALAQGLSMWIFPEGTRSPDGGIKDFKPGAFRMALDAGVPVLPVVMQGTRNLNPKGSLLMKRAMVRMRVLPAVTPRSGETFSELSDRVRQLIITEHAHMESEAPVGSDAWFKVFEDLRIRLRLRS